MRFPNRVIAASLYGVAALSHVALATECSDEATRFEISDPPYSNYFYSDCHSSSQVVVTSPLPDSNLTIIGPRFLVAWPAGNSGLVAFFEPQNGVNGSLAISLANSTSTGNALDPIYQQARNESTSPVVGVTGHLLFNSSARLTVPILGSVRTIRDFTEGPSLLQKEIQDAIKTSKTADEGAELRRLWLDNSTTTSLSFTPSGNGSVTIKDGNLNFEAGTYAFNASFDYPQLKQLSPQEVLNEASQDLITQSPEQTQSLSFLSYSEKLTAGAWRFLTYFGRDSMLSMLLMEPILSAGTNSSLEAGISALLERINKTDGSAAHEETLGDYATWLNLQDGIQSTDPQYDYKMIDTDFFVPIILADYFLKNPTGKKRADALLNQKASEDPANADLTLGKLATLNAEKIMNATAPFAAPGGQKKENLIHLKDGQVVGEWRDSTYGLGGGRIPYDVNTGIAPAGLRAIAALSEGGFFSEHPDWSTKAAKYAKVWEDKTLKFFEVEIPQKKARSLVDEYVKDNEFPFPSHSQNITAPVRFHGLALDGNNGQDLVKVMNTDDCFRHFLLNTTNEKQLGSFLSQTADNILAPYPVGLTTDVGMFVANPAYGGAPVYSANFSHAAYHGTVVWSWQLSMMAKGLERQLGRCDDTSPPKFCNDKALHGKITQAYNRLWDVIEDNKSLLSGEVWSWRYKNDKFTPVPLGELPPPDGSNPTESNIRQLWSLTFLAVKRNMSFR